LPQICREAILPCPKPSTEPSWNSLPESLLRSQHLDKYCLQQYYVRMRRCQVFWSRQVEKQLDRSPHYIRDKFAAWAVAVERLGLREVRKLSGYHDEPLKGKRKGQRSIRLSRSYRAIYVESDNGEIKIVEVLEVSKHDY